MLERLAADPEFWGIRQTPKNQSAMNVRLLKRKTRGGKQTMVMAAAMRADLDDYLREFALQRPPAIRGVRCVSFPLGRGGGARTVLNMMNALFLN